MQMMTSMDRFNDAGASQPAKSSLQKSAIAFCHNLSESECFGEIKYFCQASKMVSSFSCLELCQFVLQFVTALSWASPILGRTDFQNQVMNGWSAKQKLIFLSSRLLKKSLNQKSKQVQSMQNIAGPYMSFKHCVSSATNLAANFGCDWFWFMSKTVSKIFVIWFQSSSTRQGAENT